METAFLAAIVMGRDLLQKNEERTSLNKDLSESERNPDGRDRSTLRIIGFHQDKDGHWVAELSWGHTQHLRHQPLWQSRAWVLDASLRLEKIGQPFACGWCAKAPINDNLDA
ncbi:pressure-regulated protein [Pseudomonas fluorescens ABAC62]|nr:pressure-regulated protein [Pseudomonas fluorescens ABAC62]